MALPLENKRYTYADYITWDNGIRYELIEGIPYVKGETGDTPNAMAGTVVAHQIARGEIEHQFRNYLKGKKCRIFSETFDAQLNANEYDDTIVQPDIMVVCDLSKLEGGKSCIGAPDLAIEILSKSTAKMDKTTKFRLYEKYGVREYWIVDPYHKTVDVYTLENGKFGRVNIYTHTDIIPVHILENCHIALAEVFMNEEEELP